MPSTANAQSNTTTTSSSRRRLNVLSGNHFPAYVVWELTLKCDHACTHCGSRAGQARTTELSTSQALALVDELADMGAREVVLIGGEAYLHGGFLQVVAKLRARGVGAVMTTGGRGVTPELAQAMAEAGLERISVSIDGLEKTHDAMRARKGSFQGCFDALRAARDAGLGIQANTNINRFNRDDLEGLYEALRAAGVRQWQVQITSPLGRAADRPEMLLQPWDLLDLVPRLAKLKERGFQEGLLILPGNNLGYFGPEEALLRSPHKEGSDHWSGCQAGRFVMGIESDGAIKGCPSLQTSAYVGGRVPNQPLSEIWEKSSQLQFARSRSRKDLWGYCQQCAFGDVCLGGCSFTAHSVFGRPGNNPYCHFRAQQMQKAGKRERLELRQVAPGDPFDNGRFALKVEDFHAPEPTPAPRGDWIRPSDLVRKERRRQG